MNDAQRPLVSAGMVLGIGLGGFVDGIVFHQILQTHAMLTGVIPKDTIANVEINMFWDGIFHAVTWLMTVIGLTMLVRVAQRGEIFLSGTTLVGSMAMGWGAFNLVEGVIDHHLLNLHHVVERFGVSMYDYAFLASGVVLLVGGWMAMKREVPEVPAPRRSVKV